MREREKLSQDEEKRIPHFSNLNEDPALIGKLNHLIHPGTNPNTHPPGQSYPNPISELQIKDPQTVWLRSPWNFHPPQSPARSLVD